MKALLLGVIFFMLSCDGKAELSTQQRHCFDSAVNAENYIDDLPDALNKADLDKVTLLKTLYSVSLEVKAMGHELFECNFALYSNESLENRGDFKGDPLRNRVLKAHKSITSLEALIDVYVKRISGQGDGEISGYTDRLLKNIESIP